MAVELGTLHEIAEAISEIDISADKLEQMRQYVSESETARNSAIEAKTNAQNAQTAAEEAVEDAQTISNTMAAAVAKSNPDALVVDTTLTMTGAIAEAAATGNAITQIANSLTIATLAEAETYLGLS